MNTRYTCRKPRRHRRFRLRGLLMRFGLLAAALFILLHSPALIRSVLDFIQGFPVSDTDLYASLEKEVTKGEIPLFLQYDKRWGKETYGDDTMAVTGCGPTCLSMVVCGLTGDVKWNPLAVARMSEENGYYVDGVGTAWALMSEGAEKLGLTSTELSLDDAIIRQTLESGSPIICTMGPGDFTTTGHFIVLTGVDSQGNILVNDPNSKKNSGKSWDLDTLISQMKNLWAYHYEE